MFSREMWTVISIGIVAVLVIGTIVVGIQARRHGRFELEDADDSAMDDATVHVLADREAIDRGDEAVDLREGVALPIGAEAALWSITEVVPDPRNHLAIKDPTSELRLTEEERRLAEQDAATLRSITDRPASRAQAERIRAARAAALEKHERALRDRQPA